MNLIEELHDIICKQQGADPEIFEEYGIKGYMEEGWLRRRFRKSH